MCVFNQFFMFSNDIVVLFLIIIDSRSRLIVKNVSRTIKTNEAWRNKHYLKDHNMTKTTNYLDTYAILIIKYASIPMDIDCYEV